MTKLEILMIIFVLLLTGCAAATQPAPLTPPRVGITQAEPSGSVEELLDASDLVLKSGSLVLTVLSPTDGVTVTSSPVEVIVVSSVETVFTINGDLFMLAAGQESIFLVSLEAGFNFIELVASDYDGDQVDTILSIIYEP